VHEGEFPQIFVGGSQSHGVLTQKAPGKYDHRTVDGPATPEDYQAHLEGKQGLGLVPIREDGTCRFAAIDVDVDTISHPVLFKKVQELRMPLTVCRSKSGGAHLYVFMEEPGLKASLIVPTLKRWAGILGYPSAEIFPKQLRVTKTQKGNWINCCYFGGDATTRYAFGPEGALSLSEFLDSIVFWDGEDHVQAESPVASTQGPEPPPCLVQIQKEGGLQEGQRNSGMLQFAIFFRKSKPGAWQDELRQFNQEHVTPPLPVNELEQIIKSAGKTRYQYQCNQEPICSRCDRAKCLTLPFGVGHMPWKEAGVFDDFIASHLRKVNTDPPQYILEVNGRDVALDTDQLIDFRRLRKRVEESLDMVVNGMKAERWDQLRRDLHQNQEVIEAPTDASFEGQILSDVMDFLSKFRASHDSEDILKGSPVEQDGFICFRVLDLQRFMKLHRRSFVDNNELYRILGQQGATFKDVAIKGKLLKVWMYPVAKLNIQTESFTPIEFDRREEEM
jgi:Primase C terminal 1 (PriCT-1)